MGAQLVDVESRRYWNQWNAESREHGQDGVPLDQARVVEDWLKGRQGLSILEAGCGAGWMSERIAKFGSVVAIDMADEVIERAQQRVPAVRFIAGDLLETDLGSGYDVVVSLEVLAHVADQPLYDQRLHDALKPGGQLLLATQNKPVLAKLNRLPPPGQASCDAGSIEPNSGSCWRRHPSRSKRCSPSAPGRTSASGGCWPRPAA